MCYIYDVGHGGHEGRRGHSRGRGFWASSAPSRQSCCPSRSASPGMQTPVRQRKLPFLHSEGHDLQVRAPRHGPVCVCVCLLLQHISSLWSPQSSTPLQVWSSETHFVLAHLKPQSENKHGGFLTPPPTGGRGYSLYVFLMIRLTALRQRRRVTRCRGDHPVNGSLVVDHALGERRLVTLAADANAAVWQLTDVSVVSLVGRHCSAERSNKGHTRSHM